MASPDLSDRLAALSPAQRRLLDERLQQPRENGAREPVAIVGMACRFPGAESPQELLRLLRRGVNAVSEVPPDRWDVDRLYDPDAKAPGKMVSRWGGFLRQIDGFDCGFFGISPREAVQMDPQQRLLLEIGWEALEDAGIPPTSLAGSDTGVFVGIMTADYGRTRYGSLETIDAYAGSGNAHGMTANRLSYQLDLRGPSLAVDTACSSSLVAIHLACQSLRAGETSVALAGGVNVLLWPGHTVYFSKAGLLAADGRCKTFDASADGIVRGEGAGVVVLKTLSRARADGDRVLALVRGSAVNQDGRSNGLTAPNPAAQEAVLRASYRAAGVSPGDVSYVEAHGTGTPLGDPIEMQALGAVLAVDRPRQERCAVASIKTNFGHLEAAAGVAGLIKTVLSLRHREIFPHLHFERPNPEIPFESLPLRVPTSLESWPRDAAALAGVSSFGFGGTNAHLVLEAAPPEPTRTLGARPSHLLALSAHSATALRELGRRYGRHLSGETDSRRHEELVDVCFTANTGRDLFRHRLAVPARSTQELSRKLAGFTAGAEPEGWRSGVAGERPAIAFLFSGQGSQYVGMGRRLYETEPVFRHALDSCAELLRPHLERPLLSVLYPDGDSGGTPLLDQTAYTQPALVALELSLLELWRSWGIEPSAVLGHSVGEYAAACAAGVLTLQDVLPLIAERGRLMQALPAGGAMAAARVGEERATGYLEGFERQVAVAAVNGPQSVVLSGDRKALGEIVDRLGADAIATRWLEVSHAFHSPLMDPALDGLRELASELDIRSPKVDLISNLTGESASPDLLRTPEYWARHARRPVRFASGVDALLRAGYEVFVEIGPAPTLTGMARRFVEPGTGLWLPSLVRGSDDWQPMLESLGALYLRGVPVAWRGFDRSTSPRRISVPTTPFERRRHWLPASSGEGLDQESPPGRRLLSPVLEQTLFESRQSCQTMPFLDDHRLHSRALVPGASHLISALAAAEALAPEAHEVVDLRLLRPLMMDDREVRVVQLILDPESRELRIFSRQEKGAASWTLHATGRIGSATGEGSAVDLGAIQTRCTEELSPATFCDETGGDELSLGPAMQWLGRIRRRDGEAVARIRPPAGEEGRPGPLHPGLLDSCLRLLAATLPDRGWRTLYLPVRIGRCRLHAAVEGRLWCHATLDPGGEDGRHRTGNVRLLDPDGGLILEVEGLQILRDDGEALKASPRDRSREWLYEVEWLPAPLPAAPPAPRPGRWLILADELGLGQALAGQLDLAGGRSAVVFAGERYEHLGPDRWKLDPTQVEDFRRLFEEIGTDAMPWRGVVHLWNLRAGDPRFPSLEGAQMRALRGLLHLAQAMGSAGGEAAKRPVWLVTRGAQAAGPGDADVQLGQAPAWGLGGVVGRELGGCVCVDLDPRPSGDRVEGACEARLLAAELLAPDGEDRIALRGEERRAARLRPSRRQLGSKSDSTQMRDDGTYLITGGLGSLGMHVAGWLVERGARHLLLASRRPPSERAQTRVRELEHHGARVAVRTVDVTKADEVAALLCDASGSMPPLRGVFHAAGSIDDGLLVNQSWERFRRVLAPKLEGAWNLHRETLDLDLDAFVLFSSGASLLSPPGQGNYSAANAFLDALAHHRRHLGLPALSVNWGPWSDGGLAARLGEEVHRQWRKRGIGMIEPAQGLELLGRMLCGGAAQMAVLPIDWEKYTAQHPGAGVPPLLAELLDRPEREAETPALDRRDLIQHLEESSGDARGSLLTEYLRAEARRILRLAEDQPVAAEESLFALGLDSLMALELKNALQTGLGRELPDTLVFEHPSVADLTAHLVALLNDGFQGPSVGE